MFRIPSYILDNMVRESLPGHLKRSDYEGRTVYLTMNVVLN